MTRLGLLAVTATAATFLLAPLAAEQPAAASCVAPTVTVKPRTVGRGAVLTVTGQYFGMDCFDTGTVPPGVGPLGTPMSGLVIVINQGSNEFVVANGSAGDDYAFVVEIVVPALLQPGEAVLSIIGAGDARMTVDPPLTISNASPPDSPDETVATFGPPTTPDTEPVTVPPAVLPAEIPEPSAAVTAPPLSAVPVVARDDDNSTNRQRAISAGVAGVVAIAGVGFLAWSRGKRR